MSLAYGKNIRLTVEGGSHDEYISAELYGFPAGVAVNREGLGAFMARRAPGRSALSSARSETDEVVFLSGLDRDGFTTGGVIRFRIYNGDARPSDYDFTDTPRPSHADYAAILAYGGRADLRGGGHFSGRLTALLCAAGWLSMQVLQAQGIRVIAHAASIAGVEDRPFDPLSVGDAEREAVLSHSLPVLDADAGERMAAAILAAKEAGDSVGGVVECAVTGVPAGLGEHLFGSVEARISDAVWAIPAVRGVEFGSGFAAARLRGSENNDPYRTDGRRVTPESNHNGGVLGGMTYGVPVIFRAAFKPTPSISRPQKTVSLSKMENLELTVRGRHDPCIVPRAVPVVEAAAALALLDLCLDRSKTACSLAAERGAIDALDREIVYAFSLRMEASRRVGALKAGTDAPVYVPSREHELMRKLRTMSPDAEDTAALYEKILCLSRAAQEKLADAPALTGFSEKRLFLLGDPLGHSLSPELHAMYADYSYRLRPIRTEELADFLAAREFDALNVTIPHKKAVIPFLDELSPEAARVGAVNTILRAPDGRLTGYNTDVFGFSYLLDRLGFDVRGRRVLILGSGGAAAAVRAALDGRGCEILTFSRRAEAGLPYAALPDFIDGALIVNATPLGMYPAVEGCPLPEELIVRAGAVLDLTYNPCRTTLLTRAERAGIPCRGGMPMLAAQAAQTCALVTGRPVPPERIETAVRRLNASLRRIVLIGMPGVGKSTAARRLGELLGRPVIDTDEEIFYSTGRTPAQILREDGEDAFRALESAEILRASRHAGAVIAVGGGAVTREENYLPIRRGAVVVRLERPTETLPTDDRPISQTVGLTALAAAREPYYRTFADVTVTADADVDVDVTAARILEVIR